MTRPLLLGHRGARASRHIPENTLESFELCLRQGCDGFEFDVRCSVDGIAVVCHDPVIHGLQIENNSADVLGLPTLEQVLAQFSSRASLDIELKVVGLEAQLIAALRKHPLQKAYVVSSFVPEALRAVHALDAETPLGFLWEKENQCPPADLQVACLIPRHDLVDCGLVERAHAAGQKVMTWTVNREEDLRRFAEWGMDAIISDNTELLVQTFR